MKFFISYSTQNEKDIQSAKWVEWVLREKLGHETKIPEQDLKPGNNFMESLHDALNWADVVVLIITKAYLETRFCREEVSNAKKLFPIKFENLRFDEELLSNLAYLDLCDLNECEANETLVSAIKGVERPNEQPPCTAPSCQDRNEKRIR